MLINRGKRLNKLWPIHPVKYYAANEKDLEILYLLTYPDADLDHRTDYVAKRKYIHLCI